MDKQHGVTGICSSARTGREKLGASRDEEEHERRVRRGFYLLVVCVSAAQLSPATSIYFYCTRLRVRS